MQRSLSALFCIAFCLMVALIFPHAGTSYEKVDDSGCVDCHDPGTPGGDEGLHGISTHSDCTLCHDPIPEKGTVSSSACIVCHPLGDPGQCSLVTFHDPGKGGSCLPCHLDCESSGGESSTTTTIATQPCFAEALYGTDAEEVELLRNYRDTVLSKTAAGRNLISVYYKMSPVINAAVKENDAFKSNLKKRVDAMLPLIKAELGAE